MCGIIGLVMKENNGLWQKNENSFAQMLYCDAVRGEDSTGIIGVEKNTTFHIMKEACEATYFMQQWRSSKPQKDMYAAGKAYIGHNRKKTIGKVSDESAHPFVIGDTFAMVHNGTLNGHHQLANTEVDSEALAIVLKEAYNKESRYTALGKALGRVRGAYAVAAYDQDSHSVMLLRNSERPLGIVETDDAWYFGSETLMVAWILARNGYDYSKLKSISIPEHEAFVFDLDKSKLIREELEVKKASVPVVVGGATGTKTTAPTTATPSKVISEKDFKFFKRKWLGKRLGFEADDLIEEDYPNTIEKGSTDIMLFGRAENAIEYVHSINLVVDLKEHMSSFIGKITQEKVLAQVWSCIITEIVRQKDGTLTIYGDQPKVAKPSISLKEYHEARDYRLGLRNKPREELYAEAERIKWVSSEKWKGGAITAELMFRDQFKSVEDAIRKAKNDGVVLKQVLADGKLLYTDDEGCIYYESSVVVH